MNNVFCGNVSDFQPVVEDASRFVISYHLEEKEGGMATWRELVFYKKQGGKPSLEAVKKAVMEDINAHTKASITSGMVWNDKPVWLSEENQMNFAQAVVPVTFKIGENADGTPIYQTFETDEELKDFNDACVAYKQECLAAGYAEKDGMDFTIYDQMLNPAPVEVGSGRKKTTKK